MRKALLIFAALICTLTICTLTVAAQAGRRPSTRASGRVPRDRRASRLRMGRRSRLTTAVLRAKGRQIFGGVVPYGKEWRTGANEATTFVTTTDLMVGDKHVPAGNYTLYTIPNQQQWTLIINKQTGQWGTVYDEKQDLVRVPMKVSKTSAPVEQFTISLDKTGAKAATLKLEWADTQASVNITAH